MKPFSERIGATGPKQIQVDTVDSDLRASLWNILLSAFVPKKWSHSSPTYYWPSVARDAAREFFKVPEDELPRGDSDCRAWIKERFFTAPWYEVYDFVEYITERAPDLVYKLEKSDLVTSFNQVLASEVSAYRFIAGVLVPISNAQEVSAIEETIEEATRRSLDGIGHHLTNALRLLGRKPEPDFRNSIKESISSVESAAKLVSGEANGGLGAALKVLSERVELHGGLRQAFLSLYGYTSDEGGIRHALLTESDVGQDEAQFMLVACSAFSHYLVSKASAAGLLATEARSGGTGQDPSSDVRSSAGTSGWTPAPPRNQRK